MSSTDRTWRAQRAVTAFLIVLTAGSAHAERRANLEVPADVALSSLIALGDAHLQKMADSLQLVAMTDAARSADWGALRAPLAEAARLNVDAAVWFARPDGSYWTVRGGRASEPLSDRSYFRRLMAGNAILGDLVVSKSTGRNVGIVAVPIRGSDGAVVGALGASIYLDRLSARIEREMTLDRTMIFYSFDARPRLGLDWDTSLIMTDPHQLSPEVGEAFDAMRTKWAGTQTYWFRGKQRTVIFRRSQVTGWWYAFGIIPEGREAPGDTSARGAGSTGPETTSV